MKITYSYDLFDTVFTRRTATPHGIFALVQDKLQYFSNDDIPAEIKKNYFELRIQGEHFARCFLRSDGKEEITLSQIYQAINTTYLLNQDMIEKLMKLECETELENIIPNGVIVQEVQEHLKNRDEVIFISDMYLDKETIANMLEHIDSRWKEIPLYISSDIGKTKSSGNLFRFIHKERQIPYDKWIHTGDNVISDISVPNQLGIKTVLVQRNELIPIEKAILSDGDDTSLQMIVGISKNARKLYQLDDVESIGASLAGMLLGAYVNWILHDAIHRGIKNLYFVARDGYLLKMIADEYIQSMGYSISTKYLFGSRKAWRMPSQEWETVDFLELSENSSEIINDFDSVAKLLGIPSSQFREFLPESIRNKNSKLSKLDKTILFNYLNEADDLRQYMKAFYAKERKLVELYLEQEIDLCEKQAVFVEVGGTGYTQRCLENILRNIYKGEISSYFFQMYSCDKMADHKIYNFVPDHLWIKDALEPLCRAPHGQTLGYVNDNGHIMPLLEKAGNEKFYEDTYKRYIHGILITIKVYMDYYKDIFDMPVNRKMIKKCWDYYTTTRDEGILNFVGSVPFKAAEGEYEDSQFAPKLNKKEIEDIFGTYRRETNYPYYKGACLNLSILRMDDEEKRYMKKCQRKQEPDKGKKGDSASEEKTFESIFVRIPKGRYPKGTKIVIYGAGKVGKIFQRQIFQEQEYCVASWIDKQYSKYIKEGFPVESLKRLENIEYDIVLIAVLKRDLYYDIKKDLIKLGVPEEKIDWITYKQFVLG